jgi:hypothetical protein
MDIVTAKGFEEIVDHSRSGTLQRQGGLTAQFIDTSIGFGVKRFYLFGS